MESNEQNMGGVSRRNLLKTLGIGGGVAALGFSALFAGAEDALAAPRGTKAHDKMDSIATMANLAATAETLAATSYYGTLAAASFSLTNQARLYFTLAMDSELYHLQVLESLGGKSLANEFYIPEKFLTDFATNQQTFITAETAFTGAYLAATRRFAELGQPRLAATTAQFAATEVEHLTLQRLVAGLVPNPNSLAAPIYYNVSDAIPTLTPFLVGGPGFIGPVRFPGKDAVRALVGGNKSFIVPTFTQVF